MRSTPAVTRGAFGAFASSWRVMNAGCRDHHAAEFGEALQPPDRRVAGKASLADIVEQLVAMVGPERQAPIGVAKLLPTPLLSQEGLDDRDHVAVAGEVLGLRKRAVRLLRN